MDELMELMHPGEEARQVLGFPDYFVTSLGRVFSTKSGRPRLKKQCPTKKGYMNVYMEPGNATARIHRLVLEAFVGPRPSPRHEARHLDGCPSNNRLSNLAWGTAAENLADKERHGTVYCGTRHRFARLDPEKVRSIRACTLPVADGARLFGVSVSTYWNARTGKTWRRVA